MEWALSQYLPDLSFLGCSSMLGGIIVQKQLSHSAARSAAVALRWSIAEPKTGVLHGPVVSTAQRVECALSKTRRDELHNTPGYRVGAPCEVRVSGDPANRVSSA